MNEEKLFENRKIRTMWSAETEEWYFAIKDVVAILTDSPEPRKYWSVLKTRLKKAGVEEGLEYAILTNLMTKEWSGKRIARQNGSY